MKKIILAALALSSLLLAQGCDGSDLNDPDIKALRESYSGMNRTATIGNAYDQFYDSPKWSKQVSPKGEVLVVFEGKISSASDRYQKVVEKLDEFLKREQYGSGNVSIDQMDLYGFLYILVWDTKNAPEINKIRELDQEVKDKYNALANAIREDRENALSVLKSKSTASVKSLPDIKGKIKSLEQQIDGLYKKQNSFYYPSQGSNPFAAVSTSGQKTPTPQEKEEIKQIDIQIAQLKNEIHELQSERNREESAIMDEYVAQTRKVEEQYSPEKDQRMKTEYEPFRAERRAQIRELAMRIVAQHVPVKGDPIKITWVKRADYNNPKKFTFDLYEISGKGAKQPGVVILP